MSQRDEVLNHLRKKKYITSYEAFELYGATRLSAIIFDLRTNGIKIGGIWEKTIDRYGTEKRFKRYFIIKEETDVQKL